VAKNFAPILFSLFHFYAFVSNIFWKKNIICDNTKCRKQILKFMWNPWKYRWNKTDDEILPVFAQFSSLNFGIYILEFPWEIVSGVIPGNYLFHGFYSFRKCKNYVKYVALFWYKVFVYWLVGEVADVLTYLYDRFFTKVARQLNLTLRIYKSFLVDYKFQLISTRDQPILP